MNYIQLNRISLVAEVQTPRFIYGHEGLEDSQNLELAPALKSNSGCTKPLC